MSDVNDLPYNRTQSINWLYDMAVLSIQVKSLPGKVFVLCGL